MKCKLLLIAGVVFVLSACTLKGPEVAVRPPKVIIEPPVKVETDSHTHPVPHPHSRPRHCPPGHAKKGWC